MTAAHAALLLLCAIGFHAALHMESRARLARRGELREESVVQSPRARVLFGLSNAAVGAAYYAALAAASFLLFVPAVRAAALAAAVAAALLSLYLAYSLLFVTRRACRYCWTSHLVNWLLLALLLARSIPPS
ncbi:hypothetical protein EPN52_14355 [bacterium]|nr:MAG: hypothetical protein EPN52_14355 [bacterium]